MRNPAGLAGRHDERRQLLDALISTSALRGALVMGEAGVGKTRLAEAVSAAAVESGATVAAGACLPLGETLPFLPIVEALRALSRREAGLADALARTAPYVADELARLLPELGTGGAEDGPGEGWQRERLFSALVDLFGAVAGEGVLVLMVEDLHWADRTTLDFLAYLTAVGNPHGEVRLLGTCREEELGGDDPVTAWVTEMTRRGTLVQLTLAPLTRDATAEQVGGLLGHEPDAELVDRVFIRTGGNAFFTEQIVSARDSAAEGGTGLLPVPLAQLLLSRVNRASADGTAREVLIGLAIAARGLDESQLQALTGLAAGDLRPLLRKLVRGRLLDTSGRGRYSLRHALLGDAITADLHATERSERHAAAAELLASGSNVDAAEIAAHWAAAGRLDRELHWSLAAARAADAVYAWEEAARLWSRVLRLWDVVDETARPADVDLFSVYDRARSTADRAGESPAAEALAEEALERLEAAADTAQRARLWQNVAGYRGIASPEAGMADMRVALGLYEQLPPSAAHAEALISYDMMLVAARGGSRDTRFLERAARIAEEVGSPTHVARALSWLAVNERAYGDPDTALELAARASKAADSQDDPMTVLDVTAAHTFVLSLAGRDDEALVMGRAALERTARAGLQRYLNAMQLLANVYVILINAGRVSEAADLVLPVASGSPTRSTWLPHVMRAHIELSRGDLAAAGDRLRAVDPSWLGSSLWDQAWLAEGTAELALYRHQPEKALAIAVPTLRKLAGTFLLHTSGELACLVMRGFADAAQAARDRRDPAAVQRLVSEANDVAALVEHNAQQPFGEIPSVAVDSAIFAAERERLCGVADAKAWESAATALDAGRRPHRAAYAYWRLAEAILAISGQVPAAATALRRAEERAAEHVPLLTEIRALAQRARIDLGTDEPPASRQEPRDPLSALTPRERAVLERLVAGRTNAEIGADLYMSAKTASVHVTAILRKLGVANRVQAAGVAARAGVAPHDERSL